MAYAHMNNDFQDDTGRKSAPRVDLSFARHFVGIFAVAFSGSVYFAAACFLLRV